MKKIFFILIILMNYCTDNKEEKPNEKFLELISTQSYLMDASIVIPGYYNDKRVDIIMSTEELYSFVFKGKYEEKYKDFPTFFKDVIYEKIKLDEESYEFFKGFVVEETKIYRDYKKYGLEYIIDNYLEVTKRETKIRPIYRTREGFSIKEKWDLVRIFFYNSFVISYDDVIGRYYFTIFTTRE